MYSPRPLLHVMRAKEKGWETFSIWHGCFRLKKEGLFCSSFIQVGLVLWAFINLASSPGAWNWNWREMKNLFWCLWYLFQILRAFKKQWVRDRGALEGNSHMSYESYDMKKMMGLCSFWDSDYLFKELSMCNNLI